MTGRTPSIVQINVLCTVGTLAFGYSLRHMYKAIIAYRKIRRWHNTPLYHGKHDKGESNKSDKSDKSDGYVKLQGRITSPSPLHFKGIQCVYYRGTTHHLSLSNDKSNMDITGGYWTRTLRHVMRCFNWCHVALNPTMATSQSTHHGTTTHQYTAKSFIHMHQQSILVQWQGLESHCGYQPLPLNATVMAIGQVRHFDSGPCLYDPIVKWYAMTSNESRMLRHLHVLRLYHSISAIACCAILMYVEHQLMSWLYHIHVLLDHFDMHH